MELLYFLPAFFVGCCRRNHPASIGHCINRTSIGLVSPTVDGFGIFVEYSSKGQLLTNSSLDGCHGRKSVVPWHGKSQSVYHYDMTFEFPYTVGCFRATPTTFFGMTTGGPPQA